MIANETNIDQKPKTLGYSQLLMVPIRPSKISKHT